MLAPTTDYPLPGINAAHLSALNFFAPPFGDGGYIAPLGDYWLTLDPQPDGPAVASLVLDEDELFTATVPDLPALLAVHARAVALITKREADAEQEDAELLAVGERDYLESPLHRAKQPAIPNLAPHTK